MLSCPSTVTIGTLRSMSSTVDDFASTSSLTLYDILSVSIFTSGACAVTSTPASMLASSPMSSVPRFTSFSPASVTFLYNVALPTELKATTNAPCPLTGWLNLPSTSVTDMPTACFRLLCLNTRTVAKGSPS